MHSACCSGVDAEHQGCVGILEILALMCLQHKEWNVVHRTLMQPSDRQVLLSYCSSQVSADAGAQHLDLSRQCAAKQETKGQGCSR